MLSVLVCTLVLYVSRVRRRARRIRVMVPSTGLLSAIQLAFQAHGYSVHRCTHDTPGQPDMVWSNSARSKFIAGTKSWNRLCGFRYLEDKRVSGQILRGRGFLKSYSISSYDQLVQWIQERPPNSEQVWVLKDARANGGAGLWFIDLSKFRTGKDFSNLPVTRQDMDSSQAGFTIQQHVPGKLVLWNGRKCHFRVSAVVFGDGTAYVHRVAFVHPANKPFQLDKLDDVQVHVTNLCTNLHLAPDAFVGEQREDLLETRPRLFSNILALWKRVVLASAPLARKQRSHRDFEYVGLDVIAVEQEDAAFLIEANCPPATHSTSKSRIGQAIHDEILFDLFHYLVAPRVLDKSLDDFERNTGGFVLSLSSAPSLFEVTEGSFSKLQAACEIRLMQFLRSARGALG